MNQLIQQVPVQRLYTVRAASRYLGLNPATLRRLSDLGELRARRVGTHRMFLKEDMDAWIESNPSWVDAGRDI
jgi:excisionase family DNA binding protein